MAALRCHDHLCSRALYYIFFLCVPCPDQPYVAGTGCKSPDLSVLNGGVAGVGGGENLVCTYVFIIPYFFLSNASYSSLNCSIENLWVRTIVGSNSPLLIFSSSWCQYFCTGACPQPRYVTPFSIKAPIRNWLVIAA